MTLRPPHPRGIGHRRALGHPGLVDQPGPRAVIGVRRVTLAGAERAQDRGPRRGAHRGGPLQHPQAPGLLLGRHRRGIGRRQVAHRGRQHLQCLVGAGGRHHAAHRGVSPPPDAHGLGGRTPFPGAVCAGLGWPSPTSILASGKDILREKPASQVASIEKDSYELSGYHGTLGTRVPRFLIRRSRGPAVGGFGYLNSSPRAGPVPRAGPRALAPPAGVATAGGR